MASASLRWGKLIFVMLARITANVSLYQLFHAMICGLLAGLPVYTEHRAGRWVVYYLSGVVNCTPGLLYACECYLLVYLQI